MNLTGNVGAVQFNAGGGALGSNNNVIETPSTGLLTANAGVQSTGTISGTTFFVSATGTAAGTGIVFPHGSYITEDSGGQLFAITAGNFVASNNFIPSNNNAQVLGTAGNVWQSVSATNGYFTAVSTTSISSTTGNFNNVSATKVYAAGSLLLPVSTTTFTAQTNASGSTIMGFNSLTSRGTSDTLYGANNTPGSNQTGNSQVTLYGTDIMPNANTGQFSQLVIIGSGAATALGSTGISSTHDIIIGTNAANGQRSTNHSIMIADGGSFMNDPGDYQLNIGSAIWGDLRNCLSANCYIGINDDSPTVALSVHGALKVDGMLSSAGTSYVCTSTSTSVTSFSNTTCTVSDQKYKTNIKPFTGALDKIVQLSVRDFEFKDKAYGLGRQVGLIAQEVRPILPSLVSQGSNGDLSVDYAKLSAIAIAGIKEQQQEIAELRAHEGLSPIHTSFGDRIHWLMFGD